MQTEARRKKGFTLIELVLVVAIIGTLAAITATLIVQHEEHYTLAEATSVVRTSIDRSRMLAEAAGAQLGTSFQNCVTLDGGGPYAPLNNPPLANTLALEINPGAGTIIVPTRIRATGGIFQSDCESIRLDGQTLGNVRTGRGLDMISIETPTAPAPAVIAFSSLGQAYDPTGITTPAQWYVGLRTSSLQDVPQPGIRILPSGVVCESSFMNQVACNTDENLP